MVVVGRGMVPVISLLDASDGPMLAASAQYWLSSGMFNVAVGVCGWGLLVG